MCRFQLFVVLLALGVNSSWGLGAPFLQADACEPAQTPIIFNRTLRGCKGLPELISLQNQSLRDCTEVHFHLWLLSSLQLGLSHLSPEDILPLQLSQSVKAHIPNFSALKSRLSCSPSFYSEGNMLPSPVFSFPYQPSLYPWQSSVCSPPAQLRISLSPS